MTATTISQIKDRLRAILLLDDSGILETKTTSLRDIVSVPAAFVSTADATYTKDANDLEKIVRDFLITVLVMPIEDGYELEAENASDSFFDDVPSLFQTRPSLNTVDNTDPLPNVQAAYVVSDGGFEIIDIAGINYASITFLLRIELYYDLSEDL